MDLEIKFAGIGVHKKPLSLDFHTHRCCEIVLYTQGNGFVEIEDEKYSYKAGSIGFVKSKISHNEINLMPSKNVFIGFSCDDEAEMIDCGFYKADENIATLFFKIAEEMRHKKKGFSEMMACQLKQIILEIMRNDEKEETGDNFSYILNYINENLSLDIKNDTLSRMTHYSSDRFRHLFKEKVGLSPKQYIMEKRLQKAENILKKGDIHITDVCELCGFYDQA